MTARILELARSIPRETLDAIPRRVHVRRLPSSEAIDEAIRELRAMPESDRLRRGVISEVCRKYEINPSSVCTRITRAGETL